MRYSPRTGTASGELNGDFSRCGEAWVLTESGKSGCDKTGNVVDVPVVLTCGDDDALGVIEIRRGCEGRPDGAVTFKFFCEDAEGEAFEASGERKP